MPILGDPPENAPRMLGVVRQAEPCIPQRSMQRVHQRVLSVAEVEAARAGESQRKEWDPYYITAAEARAIPQAMLTPELLARITYSQRDWPENKMSLTDALGPLLPGEGEQYLQRGMDAGEMFWEPAPDAKSPEQMMPGRRMERPTRENR